MLFFPLFLFWLIAPFASATRIFFRDGGVAFFSCATALQAQATFCEGPYADVPYFCVCTNKNAMATMTGCFEAEGELTTDAYKYYSYFCHNHFKTNFTSKEVAQAYKYYQVAAQNATAATLLDVVSTPLIIPPILLPELFLLKDSFKKTLGNFDYSWYFGIGCLAYWALMVIASAVVNWGVYLFPQTRMMFNGPVSKLVRRYLTVPALAGQKKNVAQRFLFVLNFLLPSRLESVVLFVFFWLLFILTIIGIRTVDHDPVYNSKGIAVATLVGDRTILLAMLLTPLALLMAIRNNVLLWVTRWKYSTFLTFHRWLVRVITLLAFVHMLCYTWIYKKNNIYSEQIKKSFMAWGIVAVICGFLMCFDSLLFFRRNHYETYKIVKILCGVFWIVGMWYHTKQYGIKQIIYPNFAVWAFDYFVRACRIAWFGFPTAEVSYLPDNTLKIEVARPKSWPVFAGGHAYIHFLEGMSFWQNHPFMIYESVAKELTIVMKCKVHGGITRSLAKRVEAAPDQKLSIRVAIDGPYGFASAIHHNSTVLVAGGSAIAGAYSKAMSLAKFSSDSSRSIKLMWVVPSYESLTGFEEELQALEAMPIQSTVYVTKATQVEHSEVEESEEKKSAFESTRESNSSMMQGKFPSVDFKETRPNLQKMVEEETEEAQGSIAFVVSGPASLSDDMRKEVVRQIGKTEKRVDFFDQMQVWA